MGRTDCSYVNSVRHNANAAERPSVAVLFALTLAVGALIAKDRAAQRAIRVRPDLREWLDDTASVTGDTIEELSNAALSSYRAGLAGERDG